MMPDRQPKVSLREQRSAATRLKSALLTAPPTARANHPGNQMIRYPKFATTVIGAYSVPHWYEALDRLVAVGHFTWAR